MLGTVVEGFSARGPDGVWAMSKYVMSERRGIRIGVLGTVVEGFRTCGTCRCGRRCTNRVIAVLRTNRAGAKSTRADIGRPEGCIEGIGDRAVFIAPQHASDGSFFINRDCLNALADNRQVVFSRHQAGEFINPVLVCSRYVRNATAMLPHNNLDIGKRYASGYGNRAPYRHTQACDKGSHQG